MYYLRFFVEDFVNFQRIDNCYFCHISFFIENNNSALVQMLFSYDYFDIFHKCLCNYLRDKKLKKEETSNEIYFNALKNLLLEEVI